MLKGAHIIRVYHGTHKDQNYKQRCNRVEITSPSLKSFQPTLQFFFCRRKRPMSISKVAEAAQASLRRPQSSVARGKTQKLVLRITLLPISETRRDYKIIEVHY